MNWFDSHCHVHEDPDASAIVSECMLNGLGGIINIGTTIETSQKALVETARLASEFPSMLFGATAGIHPHDASAVDDGGTFGVFSELVQANRGTDVLVGIGECGLDYFYEYSDPEVQRKIFINQVHLANQAKLPLVIHTRDAWVDTFEILREFAQTPIIFHCFTGGPAELERCLEFESFISFSGIVTFKNAQSTAIAAVNCPLDRIIVETDSPYLAPVPFRGSKNIPHRVSVVGEFIANKREISPAHFAKLTFENTRRAFSIDR